MYLEAMLSACSFTACASLLSAAFASALSVASTRRVYSSMGNLLSIGSHTVRSSREGRRTAKSTMPSLRASTLTEEAYWFGASICESSEPS